MKPRRKNQWCENTMVEKTAIYSLNCHQPKSENIVAVQDYIETTGIGLPTEVEPLRSEIQVVLNTPKITNEVHQLLFSTKGRLRLKECCIDRRHTSLDIGIISKKAILEIVPAYITTEFLIALQAISHREVSALIPHLTESDSIDSTVLFFLSLCSVERSEVSRITPSCSIGWLARCTYTSLHDSFTFFSSG